MKQTHIDIEEIEKSADKAQVYIRDEQIILTDIKKFLNNLSYLYSTQNSKELEILLKDISLNLDKIAVNSLNNANVLNITAQKYRDLVKVLKANEEKYDAQMKSADINFK